MRALIFIGALLIAIAGIWIWYDKQMTEDNAPQNTNDLMRNDNALEVDASEVEYFAGTKGYYVRPKNPRAGGGNYPGVVMIHENRGLRPEIKTAAETLAGEGYLVLAVDLFAGGVAEDQTGARALTENFKQEIGVKNMQAAADYLKAQGASKLASLGWCFGGRQSLALATSGTPLDATI